MAIAVGLAGVNELAAMRSLGSFKSNNKSVGLGYYVATNVTEPTVYSDAAHSRQFYKIVGDYCRGLAKKEEIKNY